MQRNNWGRRLHARKSARNLLGGEGKRRDNVRKFSQQQTSSRGNPSREKKLKKIKKNFKRVGKEIPRGVSTHEGLGRGKQYPANYKKPEIRESRESYFDHGSYRTRRKEGRKGEGIVYETRLRNGT